MTQEALKLALDFVETIHVGEWVGSIERQLEVITAIKEALAQPEQEPTAFVHIKDGCLVGSHRDNSKPLADGQYGLWPAGTTPPQRKPLTDGLGIKVKRELFIFRSEQEWVNKAQSWYANCGVRSGYYITVDAAGHVMHIGKCFKNAAYPVICYELQTNWPHESAATA